MYIYVHKAGAGSGIVVVVVSDFNSGLYEPRVCVCVCIELGQETRRTGHGFDGHEAEAARGRGTVNHTIIKS